MEIIYRANDGMEFSTKEECIYHEEVLSCQELFYKFFNKKGIYCSYNDFLIEGCDEFQRCDNVDDLFKAFFPYLKNFAHGNAIEECATPYGLLSFCFKEGGFEDICNIFIRDEDGNWVLYDNWETND